MPSWTLPRMVLHDGAVETLKWCGLALMTADHAHKYVLIPSVPGLYETGRLAMPLFGFDLAYNLARAPQSGPAVYLRVLGRLLVCGAVASLPFIALGGLGFGWWPLNSMGLLAVAVSLMFLIERRGPYWRLHAALVFFLGGSLVEFWWPVWPSVSEPDSIVNSRAGGGAAALDRGYGLSDADQRQWVGLRVVGRHRRRRLTRQAPAPARHGSSTFITRPTWRCCGS